MSMDILNAHQGIAQVLPNQAHEPLPDLEGFSTISQGSEIHDVENYKALLDPDALRSNLAQHFKPQLSFNEQLQDHHLTVALQELTFVLDKVRNHEIRDLLNQDLMPLMENKQLLKAFQCMMVQG